eukprot:5592553-Amphidinium_carterae.1
MERPMPSKRGRPVSRVLPEPWSEEWTQDCPGCMGESYQHNARCLRNRRMLKGEESLKDTDWNFVDEWVKEHERKQKVRDKRIAERMHEEQ